MHHVGVWNMVGAAGIITVVIVAAHLLVIELIEKWV